MSYVSRLCRRPTTPPRTSRFPDTAQLLVWPRTTSTTPLPVCFSSMSYPFQFFQGQRLKPRSLQGWVPFQGVAT
ncbi:hypothetical protein M3J09_006349 [Ascochyta lentis]